MVHDLEVPLALSGLEIKAHEAVAKQVVPGTLTAVLIGGRVLDRQIDQPQLLIHRDLRPDASVAVHRVRIVLPGLGAELSRVWNGVELPQHLSRPNVEGPN